MPSGGLRSRPNPRRVVVLNQYSLLDCLLAVGVKPVGSSGDAAAGYPFTRWLHGGTPCGLGRRRRRSHRIRGAHRSPRGRAICGPDYRWVLPYSALLAPVLLLVAAFVGAPFFIALVRRRKLAEL